MSQSSPTTDRPPNAGSAATGPQNPISHTSGANAESRPSTASTIRPEVYGGYDGNTWRRSGTEAGRGDFSRRQSTESTARTASRALGVHSILNPQLELEEKDPFDIRSTGQPPMSLAQTLLARPGEMSPRSRKRTDPRSPPREYGHPGSARMGRRLLTPKSPAVRAASLGPRRNPTFHSTFQARGPGGQLFASDPARFRQPEVPPLPPLTIATGPGLKDLVHPEAGRPPRSAHVRESPTLGFDPGGTFQADRPSAVQTLYPKIEQPSPIYRYGLPPSQPPNAFRVLPAGMGGGFGHESQMHGPHEGYQSGQTSYQMTLETDQGPMVVPVELDLQQASKVADEKRKRNAGASARFRARRKEKEKEASQTISGLQQELRNLMEEREFYLLERNYFREIASRHVPSAQLLRPPSPQHRRLNVVATGPGTPTGGSSDPANLSEDSYQEYVDSAPQRRRTGDYQPSFGGRPAASPPQQGYSGGYPPQPPIPLPPPAATMGPYGSSRALPPGPPGPPSAPLSRSQSYEQFRRDAFDRPWGSGR